MGTAESDGPLDEDDDEKVVLATHEDLGEATFQEQKGASLSDLSTADLSLVTKFGIFAVIVAACYAFVRSRGPRRVGPAGRHGAYEKGGLP